MALDTLMDSGGAQPMGGGGRVGGGGGLDTTMSSLPPVPSVNSGTAGTYDRNTAPFSQPRASGGIPVKFYESVTGSPGTLESTLEDKNLVR